MNIDAGGCEPTARIDGMQHCRPTLSVGVVTYRSDESALYTTLDSLAEAIEHAIRTGALSGAEVVIVDNAASLRDATLLPLKRKEIPAKLVLAQQNLGYGGGQNLAFEGVQSDYHLVLNPDVFVGVDAIRNAIRWMDANPSAVLLAPDVCNLAGERRFLCRRMPSVFVLFLRGFAPRSVARVFRRSLAWHEMRDVVDGEHVVWDPPMVSGCFMLFRSTVYRALEGFDRRYFLYFEDYDLSLRAASQGRLAYVPHVRISHAGGGASRKGLRHILMFGRSALTFFRLHGWRA